jgi:putative DNA primase/helicase
VRGDGGLIVAPPSVHASGREYAWDVAAHPDEVPLAAAPGWLLTLLDNRPGGLRRDGSPLLVRDGTRNDTLFRLGCALRHFGVGEPALLDCMRGINREHCRPPLAEDEVRKIAASAARYAPGMIESPRKIKMKVV